MRWPRLWWKVGEIMSCVYYNVAMLLLSSCVLLYTLKVHCKKMETTGYGDIYAAANLMKATSSR